jgi:DDE superfamily endonuclease
MELVTSFAVVLQSLAPVMTAPSFQTWTTMVTGWVFARRRAVTQMIVAAGAVGEKHFSSFHRFFSQAAWSRDELGLAVFGLLEPWLGAVVYLGVDDTLARKRGLKMFGTAMHIDPLLSSRGYKVTNWGHCWVVLSVLVEFPLWPGRYFSLPVLFRLYLGKKKAKKLRQAYRTKPELTIEMGKLLCGRYENRRFHLIGDSAYGGQSILGVVPSNCDVTSRAVLDARLYDPPAPRQPGARGRTRRRGQKLPTPHQMLDERCRRVELSIYGRTESARVAEAEARMFAVPERPLRIVAVEALAGGRGREAFYSTVVDATAEEVLTWYSMRWSVEVTFHDCKQHLGFEDPPGWSRQAVERTAPMAMLLYSVIVHWYAKEGHHQERLSILPWYPSKSQASFADMLATLKRVSLRQRISALGLRGPGARKTQALLENLVNLAA